MPFLKKINRVDKALELLTGKSGILRYQVPAKSFLYYPAYIAALFGVTLSSILAIPDLSNYARFLTILAVNIGFSAVVLISLYIFNEFWTKKNLYGGISIFKVALVGLMLGGVKGVLTWYALTQQGFEEALLLGFSSRLVISASTGAFAAASLLLFVSFVYQYNQERDKLILKDKILGAGENYPAVLRNFVQYLKKQIGDIGNGEPQDKNLASKIRQIVLEELRPFSLGLWGRDNATLPRLSLTEITKISIARYAYSLWIVPAWVFSSLPATIEILGSDNAVLAQSLRAVILTLGLLLLRYIAMDISKYGFLPSLLLYIFSIITISISLVYSGSFFAEGRTLATDAGLILLNILWIFQLSLTFGYIKSVLRLSDKLHEMRESYSEDELRIIGQRQAARLEDRRIAQFLHGHIQSKLVALANDLEKRQHLRITGKDMSDNVVEYQNQLSQDLKVIEKALDGALEAFNNNTSTSVLEALDKINLDWGEIIKIEVHSLLELNEDIFSESEVNKIQEIINEGIANAVRHGLASEVSINIRSTEIVIIDNGIGVKEGEKGLGSIFLDQVSPDWSINNTAEGTTLRVPLG
jgi:signal transduction histidine kinase